MNTSNTHLQLVEDTFPSTIDERVVRDFNLIERYVARSLPQEIADAFEDYYLDKPELVAQIRIEKALRDELEGAAALLDASESSHLAQTAAQSMASDDQGGNTLWKAAAGIMAALLFGVAGTAFQQMQRLDQNVASLTDKLSVANAPKVVAATFALGPTRSGTAQVPRPAANELYALSIAAESGIEYSVQIKNIDSQAVWSNPSLSTMSTGRLSVLIGHDTLEPGDYTLHASANDASNPTDIPPLSFSLD